MDDGGFDKKCRKVVTRRIAQQMRDYRLNPRLEKAEVCGNLGSLYFTLRD